MIRPSGFAQIGENVAAYAVPWTKTKIWVITMYSHLIDTLAIWINLKFFICNVWWSILWGMRKVNTSKCFITFCTSNVCLSIIIGLGFTWQTLVIFNEEVSVVQKCNLLFKMLQLLNCVSYLYLVFCCQKGYGVFTFNRHTCYLNKP